ncbi:MAG: hypothetical protein HFH75_17905, partial [Lachnospiraceae bacterium]|nr:hypothetical protein [Lachnospiraceae bacterium]
ITFTQKTFESGASIKGFLPFLDKEAVRMFADKTLETGGSINAFLPFLSKQDIRNIAFTTDDEE